MAEAVVDEDRAPARLFADQVVPGAEPAAVLEDGPATVGVARDVVVMRIGAPQKGSRQVWSRALTRSADGPVKRRRRASIPTSRPLDEACRRRQRFHARLWSISSRAIGPGRGPAPVTAAGRAESGSEATSAGTMIWTSTGTTVACA
ncbi:MAG: hypothetical protein ACRYG2_31185 [Janthinobacterium lividum]